MNRIILFCLLIASCFSSCGKTSAASEKTEPVNIDTLSYAKGFEYSVAIMAGKNDFITNLPQVIEYVKAMEDRLQDTTVKVDTLQLKDQMPRSAAELGRYVAQAILMSKREGGKIDVPSVISGAKAAFGLEEPRISRETLDNIFFKEYEAMEDSGAYVPDNDSSLQIEEIKIEEIKIEEIELD